jgi:hypothetical protein
MGYFGGVNQVFSIAYCLRWAVPWVTNEYIEILDWGLALDFWGLLLTIEGLGRFIGIRL